MSEKSQLNKSSRAVGRIVLEVMEKIEDTLSDKEKEKGISLQRIDKYIYTNLEVEEGFQKLVKVYLKKALNKGLVSKVKGVGLSGSFILNRDKVEEEMKAKGSNDEDSELEIEEEAPKKTSRAKKGSNDKVASTSVKSNAKRGAANATKSKKADPKSKPKAAAAKKTKKDISDEQEAPKKKKAKVNDE